MTWPDRFQTLPTGALSHTTTVVLLAMLADEYDAGRTTARSICLRTGLQSPSSAHFHLKRLRAEGLISWQDGERGTLRAAVKVEVFGYAGDAPRERATALPAKANTGGGRAYTAVLNPRG